jgi:hypothetical protein
MPSSGRLDIDHADSGPDDRLRHDRAAERHAGHPDKPRPGRSRDHTDAFAHSDSNAHPDSNCDPDANTDPDSLPHADADSHPEADAPPAPTGRR